MTHKVVNEFRVSTSDDYISPSGRPIVDPGPGDDHMRKIEISCDVNREGIAHNSSVCPFSKQGGLA